MLFSISLVLFRCIVGAPFLHFFLSLFFRNSDQLLPHPPHPPSPLPTGKTDLWNKQKKKRNRYKNKFTIYRRFRSRSELWKPSIKFQRNLIDASRKWRHPVSTISNWCLNWSIGWINCVINDSNSFSERPAISRWCCQTAWIRWGGSSPSEMAVNFQSEPFDSTTKM